MSEKTEVRAFPAPEQLATPTDLSSEAVQKITDAVKPLVADAFALYAKTKNFHWHLSGARFRDLHLLFDEHAEAIISSVDLLAERVRRIGGTIGPVPSRKNGPRCVAGLCQCTHRRTGVGVQPFIDKANILTDLGETR